MIPFYFFRKEVKAPVASFFYSGILDDVDYWGFVDRREIAGELEAYGKRYALDWALTASLFVFLGVLIDIAFCFFSGIVCDLTVYWNVPLIILLTYLLSYWGIKELVDGYVKALDLNGRTPANE